jgi:crossover junction endodeoxyribonuclease RuvC
MTSYIIGVDPGLSGAIAIVGREDQQIAALSDLPVARTPGKLAWIDGAELQSLLIEKLNGHEALAIVEAVHSMPKQGVASTFAFGVAFGSVLSILQARRIPLHLVAPTQWKRDLQLNGKGKDAPLYKARLLWPMADLKLAKHHGRAEALLLTYWFLYTQTKV